MVSRSEFRKKSESTPSEEAREKDRLIAELKDHIAVLESELRLKRECAPFSEAAERKRAEAELIKKNDDLAALNGKLRELSQAVEQSPATVVITDTKGNIEYVNPKFTELTGYSFEEAIGNNPRVLKTGETPPEEYKRLWETITSGKTWHGVFHNKKKNGDLYWESAIISPIMDDSGKITNFIAVKEDITERKRAEDALRASEEKYRELVENANSIILRFDMQGNLTFFNEYAEKLFGYSRGEALGRDVVGTIVPPSESTGRNMDDIIEDMKRYPECYLSNVNENVCKNGDRVWIAWTNKAIRDEQGNVVEILSVGNDVTERKRMEEALRESEARFSAFMDNSPGIAWMKDEEGLYVYLNKVCGERFGIELDHWLWKTDHELFSQDIAGRYREVDREVLASGRMIAMEDEAVGPDGRRIQWLCVKFPFKSASGKGYVGGIAVDITESKRAEEALRKSEASLARSQAIAHLANWEMDVDTGRVRVSDEFYRIFNLEPGVPQESYGEKIYPGDRARILESVKATIHEGKPYSIDYRILPRPGEVRHIHAEGETIRDRAGRPLSFFGTVQDITERKRAEEALRVSEEKFRVLAETTRAAIVLVQGNKLIYVNPTVERVLGYSRDELMAMNYWDMIHPDSMELLRSMGQLRSMRMPVPSNYELKALTKSGETRWGEFSVASIDYGDKPTIIATIFDITERKQAEDALRVSEERLRRTSRAGQIGLYEWNEDHGTVYMSLEAYELFGLEPGSTVTYEKFFERLHPDDREMFRRSSAEAREKAHNGSSGTAQGEFRVMHEDGSVLWLEATATYDLEGGDVMVRGAVRDITERKRAEEELANAKAQAELYVDLMGHDINNFNLVARGYLELMDGMVEDEKLKELVSKPLEAIDSSSRLIQNVQKLQRARSGGNHLEALDLGALVGEVAGQFTSTPDKPVDVTCHAVKGVRVRANELLRDVFVNLVGNAIKHSAGPACVNIRVVPEEKDGRGYCRVIIDDNGPGVPDDMKEKIFNRLSRGNTKAKGSGLGLYLVKSLVESYGGRVWVEDLVPGDHTQGARFVVMLPVVEK